MKSTIKSHSKLKSLRSAGLCEEALSRMLSRKKTSGKGKGDKVGADKAAPSTAPVDSKKLLMMLEEDDEFEEFETEQFAAPKDDKEVKQKWQEDWDDDLADDDFISHLRKELKL